MQESSQTESKKSASLRSVVADGEKIRALRKQQGLTQEALAHKAGLSQKTIATSEKSQAMDLNTVTRIADALGVGYDEVRQPPEPLEPPARGSLKLSGALLLSLAVAGGGLAIVGIIVISIWLMLADGGKKQGVPPKPGIQSLLQRNLWIAYNPSDSVTQTDIPESGEISSELMGKIEESIRQDLRVILKQTKITGLVTFGSNSSQAQIPKWAKEEGFAAVIVGVFIHPGSDADNRMQMQNAKNSQEHADAYLIYYNQEQPPLNEIHRFVHELQRDTGKPAAARLDHTQHVERALARIGDFDSPDVLNWERGRSAKEAFDELQRRIDFLSTNLPPERPALLGMVSLPSGPESDFTEDGQKSFYQMILGPELNLPPNMSFYFYDAFDPPVNDEQIRSTSPEFHRGIFQNDRTPKPVVEVLNR